jgi:hypothetical protein
VRFIVEINLLSFCYSETAFIEGKYSRLYTLYTRKRYLYKSCSMYYTTTRSLYLISFSYIVDEFTAVVLSKYILDLALIKK